MKSLVPMAILFAAGVAVAPVWASSKSYALSGFDKVAASNHVNVILKQGPFSIQVSEPTGRFEDLILEVRGQTLMASRRPQFNWFGSWDGPIYTITVTAPAYSSIEATSHSSVRGNISATTLAVTARDHADITSGLASRNLTLSASNHASITGDVATEALSIAAGDHAVIDLTGRCADMQVTAVNHASVDGHALKCSSARVAASDHADVGAWADRAADGRASNHAGISVYGHPASLQQQSFDHASVTVM